MFYIKRLLIMTVAVFGLSAIVIAQPRPTEKTPQTDSPNAPDSYETRYEGGIFGSSSKEKGTLKFDDTNERIVFYRETGKEMFSIPYASLIMVYPDSKESVPQSGKVISALPLPGAGLASLMSKSTKYANLTFDDPDIEAKGTASFRFKEKALLLTFIAKLGEKAKLKPRGDAYYRPRNSSIY